MSRVIECVPNISEGRDEAVYMAVAAEAETVEGVALLDVDPGKATNRTVITFAGPPEAVLEAAVRLARKAKAMIDMRQHKGEHPRFGAVDVCPLVPISGVTMEETVEFARELARRLAEEVGLGVFCYENAAFNEERRNLATVRAGEYEALPERLADPRWKPDFGPSEFDPGFGVVAVSARDFLVAYNVNLNTTSTRRANAIAFDVRERGRPKREGHPLTGPIAKDAEGKAIWIPGSLKCAKAIGWFIEEYGVAQISINLTNISITSIHKAFDEVCAKANARGVRVTGSEIVGLVPLEAMLDAGRHYLRQQSRSTGVSDAELIKIAARSMGLAELTPFEPEKKIIEYVLAARTSEPRLVDLSVRGFVEETAAESPAPGGGSVAATVGALGAALGTMVANLSSHKRGWDERWEEFSDWAEKGKAAHAELTRLVDADTDAFNVLMDAFGLPKSTDEEKLARTAAIQEATRHATDVPLRVMEVALEVMDTIEAMAKDGMQSSISDAGVGALCARTAVRGAGLNVRINAKDLTDETVRRRFIARADELEASAAQREDSILAAVQSKL